MNYCFFLLGFRALCYEILNQEDKVTSLDGYTYIENFITKSGIVWKSVRRRWIQLLVEVGLKNPKNKIPLSMLYLKHYRTLMTDYLGTIFKNYILTFQESLISYQFLMISTCFK